MFNPQNMFTNPYESLMNYGSAATQAQTPAPQVNWFNPFSWDSDMQTKMLGGKLQDGTQLNGMIPTGIGAVSGLAGAWSGMQQLKLGKKQLAFQKDAFAKNWANQTKMLNTRMQDRQKARVAFDPRNQDVASYMKENGVQ